VISREKEILDLEEPSNWCFRFCPGGYLHSKGHVNDRMIECKDCSNYFHQTCLKLNDDQFDALASETTIWTCFGCIYRKKNCAELKSLLREQDESISVSGRKEELIDRLIQIKLKQNSPNQSSTAESKRKRANEEEDGLARLLVGLGASDLDYRGNDKKRAKGK